MANFGIPDFDYRTPDQQRIDQEAPILRAKLKAEGKMYMWPHNEMVSAGYPPDLVQEHCVRNAEWQKIRLSMKGIPTHEKLAILKSWWDTQRKHALSLNPEMARTALATETEIQVGNYLGALRRGGQLDAHNQVRRYI